MSRQVLLLSALGAVLLLVAFYFLAWAPQSERIAEIETEIEATLAQQAQTTTRIRALEEVRARAPEIEAAIGATDALIPRDPALPSALRQLQLAADDSGVTLLTVASGRPTAVGEGGAAELTVTISMTGSYFQVVDFLRRVEDPSITPRAILWSTAAVSVAEYPELSVSLSGSMYAVLPPTTAPAAPAAPAEPETTPTEGATEGEAA